MWTDFHRATVLALPIWLGFACADEGASDPEASGGTAGAPSIKDEPCSFDITYQLSPAIGTVVIVEWSVALNDLRRAAIEFGPDGQYSMQAPVDLSQSDRRTLLLGIGPDTPVSFRIIAEGKEEKCTSEEQSITTGPAPNSGFFANERRVVQPDKVAPGFFVTSQFLGSRSLDPTGTGSFAYILNHKGELVWWKRTELGNISRALLSYDGKHVFARNVNVGANASNGEIVRISLDGLESDTFRVPASHHDMAPLPDGDWALIEKESGDGTCDEVVRWSPGEATRKLFDMRDAYPSGPVEGAGSEECHSNAIRYNQSDQTLTISDLFQNSITKITVQGDLVWVLGGVDSHFSGVKWDRQHGHHMVSEDQIFFFNNGSGTQDSVGIEVDLDLEAGTATSWSTEPSGFSSRTLGDAQVLPNGNYLLTYSNDGVIEELDPQGQLVQRMSFRAGGALGYVNHRPSLYGAPSR